LEARRLQYGIPDGAFRYTASFERVLVWQIPVDESVTVPGGIGIIKPETTISREAQQAPLGIILSAGLKALSCLKTHGIQLGERVVFVRYCAWRLHADWIAGKEEYVYPINVGDITASEDMAERLRTGETNYVWDPYAATYFIKPPEGEKSTAPADVWVSPAEA
jgi:hypothetical protein